MTPTDKALRPQLKSGYKSQTVLTLKQIAGCAKLKWQITVYAVLKQEEISEEGGILSMCSLIQSKIFF